MTEFNACVIYVVNGQRQIWRSPARLGQPHVRAAAMVEFLEHYKRDQRMLGTWRTFEPLYSLWRAPA